MSVTVSKNSFLCLFVLITLCLHQTNADNSKKDDKYASLKKKKITDYNDADIERLFDQWEEADEPLEEDELPEWKRPRPKIDMTQFDANNPEAMLQMSKKGQTLMIFATISGEPTEAETEQISLIWQTSLFNANYEIQRYVVGSNRILLMLKDGSKAWEVKDYLLHQDRCELVTIEGKDYYGKGSKQYKEDEPKKSEKKKKSKPEANKQKTKKNVEL